MAKKDKFIDKFMISDYSDGLDTVLDANQVIVIPIETLDDERKDQIENGDCDKIFAHGDEFPGIHLSAIFHILDKNDLLEDILNDCRDLRLEMDGKKVQAKKKVAKKKVAKKKVAKKKVAKKKIAKKKTKS